jgi:Na+-driven multidrug efflux pump
LSFVVLGPQMLAVTGIQAFGRAKEALVLSFARQGLFYIPLLFMMQEIQGFEGLIWAQPVSDIATLLLGTVFLSVILRKYLGKSKLEA